MAVYRRKIPERDADGKIIKNDKGKTVYHQSENWTVDVRVNGRRIKREVGSNKQIALSIEKKMKVQEAEGKYLDVLKDRKVTFDDVVKDFWNTRAITNAPINGIHSLRDRF